MKELPEARLHPFRASRASIEAPVAAKAASVCGLDSHFCVAMEINPLEALQSRVEGEEEGCEAEFVEEAGEIAAIIARVTEAEGSCADAVYDRWKAIVSGRSDFHALWGPSCTDKHPIHPSICCAHNASLCDSVVQVPGAVSASGRLP